MAAAVSMVTMSPDSMVSAGLLAALKLPMFTVCGLGIRVYSAARAAGAAAMTAVASKADRIVFVVIMVGSRVADWDREDWVSLPGEDRLRDHAVDALGA